MIPSSFSSIGLTVWEMSFEEFQEGHHGGHLGYQLEQSDFSNSESLCHSDASHQVLVQSNLQFGRRCGLKNFKMAAMEEMLKK